MPGRISLDMIAQILGALGVGLSLFIFSASRRKTILICKFSGDVLWFFHYLLIGATSGAATNIVNMMREVVFYHKDKKWASHKGWLALFICLNVASSLLTWEGPISILPMLGCCCTVISLWCTKPLHIRLVATPGMIFWLLYGIFHGSVTGILNNSISLISIAIGFVKDFRERRKTTA